MPVEENFQLAAFYGESHYFPQFPHQSVCTDYLEHCAGAIAMVPELAINCTEDNFPSQKKKILSYMEVGADIYTEVNYMNDSTKTFVPECPSGFRPPTDPAAVDRMYAIEPSGCVMECLSAVYTLDEYKVFKDTEFSIKFLSVCFLLISALSVYMTPEKKRNIYLTVLVVVESIMDFTMLVNLFEYLPKTGEPGTMPTCDSPTQWVELAGSCLLEGLLYHFGFWAQRLLLLSAVTELWLRVVPQVKKINKLHFVLPFTIILFSLSLWLLLGGDGMNFAAGSNTIYCSIQNPALADTQDKISQVIVYGCLAFYVWAMWKCITTTLSANKAENPFTKLWKTYRVLFYIGFVSILLAIYIILDELTDYDKINKNTFDWTMCLFMEYINPNQDDYLGYCGQTPKYRIEMADLHVKQFIGIFKCFLILMATLNEHVSNEYLKFFASIENTMFGSSYIEENFVNNRKRLNAFHTSQVSRGVTSSNVVQSTILDSSFEAVEKYKPKSDLYTLEEASSRKYAVAPMNDDESKEGGNDVNNHDTTLPNQNSDV